MYGSRGSTVSISSGYRLDDWGVGVQVLVKSKIFSSPHRPGYGAHPAPYPVGTRIKVVGAWSWPLASNKCRGQENMALYIHSLVTDGIIRLYSQLGYIRITYYLPKINFSIMVLFVSSQHLNVCTVIYNIYPSVMDYTERNKNLQGKEDCK